MLCFVMLCYVMLTAVCNNRCYYVSSYIVAVCCANCVSCVNMMCYDNMFYCMLSYHMKWWFDVIVGVMVWYVTCVIGVLTYVMLSYVNICYVTLLALYNITCYVMTCHMIAETLNGDTHFHREQKHDSKYILVLWQIFQFYEYFGPWFAILQSTKQSININMLR